MHIFIDTNIYLNFYELTNEDIAELNKLLVLQQNKDIVVLLTEQVRDEFYRNRENKIANAVKQFKEDSIRDKIPNMAKSYDEYNLLNRAKAEYSNLKSKILEKIQSDIELESLPADLLISKIFERSLKLELTDLIFDKAFKRDSKGNPPGKRDSMGDAINYELLLDYFCSIESPLFLSNEKGIHDIHIISSDGDYQSELNTSKPKEFLTKEWKNLARGELFYYNRISQFTKQYFPEIDITLDAEKPIIIRNLVRSGSFAQTHQSITELSKFSKFSKHHLDIILKAAVENSQIRKILTDEDVFNFLIDLVKNHEEIIDFYAVCNVLLHIPKENLETVDVRVIKKALKINSEMEDVPF